MKQRIPQSPFATGLSGSAKETELRIRSIFQWKKKRPPMVLLVLAGLVALLCGSVVSCQPQAEPDVPENAAREELLGTLDLEDTAKENAAQGLSTPPSEGLSTTEDDMPPRDSGVLPEVSEETALIAYRETLMRMLQEVNATGRATLPDGVSQLGFWAGTDHLEENLFAVCDVDGDGQQELLFRYISTLPESQTEYIFGCDASGELRQKFSTYPPVSYYENGLMLSRCRAQNESKTIWPYGVYRYNPSDGVYDLVTDASSWEKGSRSRSFNYDEADFPDDVDADGDGVVYIVGTRNPDDSWDAAFMDRIAYEQWYDSFFADTQEIIPDWKPFTAESIAALGLTLN